MEATDHFITNLKMGYDNLTGLVSKLILPKEKISIVPLCVGDSFKPVNNEILNQRR